MKIGNRVEIISTGGLYRNYLEMAQAMNLKAFNGKYGTGIVGLRGIVVAIKTHTESHTITCIGIELDNGHSVVFDNRKPSLKRLPDKFSLDEELFTL